MVLVLGIVKASLEILGIGIGVTKVVLLMSGIHLTQSMKEPCNYKSHPLVNNFSTLKSLILIHSGKYFGLKKSNT